MDYSGNIITKNPVQPSLTSASGVWTLDEAAAAVKANKWPVAGVPNPIQRSLRFRSSASAYLNRTPAGAGNRQTWTWSGWVKRGKLTDSAIQTLLGTTSNTDLIGFDTDDTFRVWFGANTYSTKTTQVFRDPSSWYHFVVAVDTTQATASNRLKIYVNGSQITALSASYPTQNYNTGVDNTVEHRIGKMPSGDYNYFDGYLTEINFIDGQALTPSSFGYTNPLTGVWQSLPYTGTYGANGFYLPFTNITNTTTIGYDFSGNNNNWTSNNISLTSGSTYDSMTDVPTLTSATQANYAVMNPLWKDSGVTIADGNLNVSGGNYGGISTMLAPTGNKYYCEFTVTATEGNQTVGVLKAAALNGSLSSIDLNTSNGYGYYSTNGNKTVTGTSSAYGSSWGTIGDVIGIALDMVSNQITFYKNNTSQGAISIAASTDYFFAVANATSTGGGAFNFGQQPFKYTAPTGFVALNTFNLSTPTIQNGAAYMAASLYTGTGANGIVVTNTVGSTSFQPDFSWVKSRSTAGGSSLSDSVRGVNKHLTSNVTNAEDTETGTAGLQSYNSNGFTMGTQNAGAGDVNANGTTYVAWQWKANGSGSTNTNGSITSTVSANTTAGFSIVTYTGNGTSGATVGHGLGAVPSMVIVKSRLLSTESWPVKHISLSSNKNLLLNSTTDQYTPGNGYIADLSSSTTFALTTGVTNADAVNKSSSTYVAYCFTPIAGYNAFGSYTGNGSADGPFVYLGFRPRFVMFKRTDSTGSWFMEDSSRGTYNVMGPELYANTTDSETNVNRLDFLSNGFKMRAANAGDNASGGTYIYACFAENPFKVALAR